MKLLGKIGDAVTEKMGMAGLKIRANSPEILLIGGIVSMGGALFFAWRAGTKTNAIMADHLDRVEDAKMTHWTDEDGLEVIATDKQVARQVRSEYVKTGIQLAKTFAPTAICTGVSVGCFVSMHNIQAGMITSLSAAYTGIQEAFRQYQDNNIKLNGEESHRMCKYGFVDEKYTDEDGYTNVRRRAKTADEVKDDLFNNGMYHDHIYVFGRMSTAWKGMANIDVLVLEQTERWANIQLSTRGWVLVNEVLDALGLPRTLNGMVEGWWKGGGEAVDLGWRDPINNLGLAAHNNHEWILEFNVHGNVYSALYKQDAEKEAREMELAELKAAEEAMGI